MKLFDGVFNKREAKQYKIFDSEEEACKAISLNKAVTVQIDEIKICLARTVNGFFAIQNSCPHLGESLSKGTCNNFGEIICPWHSYRFNLMTGFETTGHNMAVKKYKVEVKPSGLYISL